jgi:DNA polymerase III alpha subunit
MSFPYLVQPNLMRMKSIDSIEDLAIITSIWRPGPLKMGMDQTFIKRKNGEEPIEYLHPLLENILKSSYGITCFQEQVMQTVQELGGLSGDESVTVLKGMGKKDLQKILKYKEKFLKNAQGSKGLTKQKSEEIWEYLQAFAEYGFNRSHAIAYACVSYLCMWFKTYYTIEWVAAVLENSDKDDFKSMYQKWKDYIQRPNVNYSKMEYYIDNDSKTVVMPFSSVNGVGDKAVESIVAAQPFSTFADFFNRVEKRKVNKKVFLNLIFSGCFDHFKTPELTVSKFRKALVHEFIDLRYAEKKPSKADKEADDLYLTEIEGLTRGKILMKEVDLLNFTAFDYHAFFKEKMTVESRKLFGVDAMKPEEVLEFEDKKEVVIGGAIESIAFVPIKTGKQMGKEMAMIKFTNNGHTISVTIFPGDLERDDKHGGELRKLVPFTPMIIKGSINLWNGRFGVIYKTGVILA